MKKGLHCLFAGCTLFCGGFVPTIGAAEPRLVVSVNNTAGFDQETLVRAEQIVTAIFRDVGVRVEWQGTGGLRVNLVAIRPTAMGLHKDVAGLAGLPGDGQPGFLAWVFQPTLEKIIDQTQYLTQQRVRRMLLNVLLGQVIAHEMGHLLLGSAEHSDSGIMTLGWDLRKVRLACTGSLRFSPKQAEKIRATVQAMNRVDYALASRAPR